MSRHQLAEPSLAVRCLDALARGLERHATSAPLRTARSLRIDASQLRLVATLTMNGTYSEGYAWMWADAGAAHLHHYQTETKASTRA